ncbi:MBL fold metallo-hydrolase [Clostridium botulinum]|uniref:Zn-dependent hydrolase n=1 Tax=Clostridium botulinum C/D str. DC5 TaxID=1443128 RepID=A0A0A0IM54_CLOBO|nr:MBL fold metallo-hydrolase [Clostridium botulinum]KEI01517.1 Zn-dependent hydrolase [Clostridium botulinum C/D str. BKT75002]KEI07851.1 Zn-dependent hydrolase [Clostridium botulinum C/D str. BKT2873]KGM94861.1 Zn-dependent hydrolase [Clostridium botulinum D str. CCUG 7971]KGN01252.1 Zn-dependent hydrolase [Clostridium botulinum C/D str. DC5]KOC49547.1 Zn-dependent hydrolase [Clostridium botulinum]
MYINKVGSRGYVFTFDELKNTEFDCTTNVYLIDGNRHIFICDTFLGPKYMKEVKKFIDEHLKSKPIIVFNSHCDWDHIWGNCFFKENLIITHVKCRQNINKYALDEFVKYNMFHEDNVGIVVPNLTFNDKICFDEDMVEFFYSPGHTECSASCLDIKDNILFVGDNVESPKPYLTCNNTKKYIETLEYYIKINANVIIPGHGDIANNDLVNKNLYYIKSIKEI